ncbi:MAG: DinB family protein [Ginsengibacter sp.]
MQKEFLQNILAQNQMTCSFAFDKISNENAGFRLNKQAASAGFIYRHIGETINLFLTFFGVSTDVQNTTIGKADEGQGKNIEECRQMVNKGYSILEELIQSTADEEWLGMIDTPFFGTISRLRLFSHILFHNSHHAGQISMTLSKGTHADDN